MWQVEEEERAYRAFGFLHIWLGFCFSDKLAHLIHLPKRHLSEETDEYSRQNKWETEPAALSFNNVILLVSAQNILQLSW